MRHDLINVTWTAAPLSSEQKYVVRKLAVLFLRQERTVDHVDFTHLLIEGRLTFKGRGVLGMFVGSLFRADMGTERGERWTLDFLLPAGSERIPFNDETYSRSCTGRTAVSSSDSSILRSRASRKPRFSTENQPPFLREWRFSASSGPQVE